MSQMVLGSLAHLPSSDYGQELLLRILCYVAQLNGRVTPSESEFVETVAGAMGHRAWEFPEAPTRLSLRDLAGLRSTWSSSSERIWLTALFRRLAAADGIVCKDEELFLDELTALLFSSLPTGTRSIARSELASDEQQVITAAINAADSIAVTDLWHRKTGKAVGAALGVETEQGFEIFTGVNFELSQPTGSRCAEQVAIGSALARHGDRLRYSHVKMIAVAAGQQVPEPISNPLPPCGVCCEMIHKLNEAEQQIRLYLRDAERTDHVLCIDFADYYPPSVPGGS